MVEQLKGYSPVGCSNSVRKFQGQRPSLFDFEAQLRAAKEVENVYELELHRPQGHHQSKRDRVSRR
jgi:hypothetical protein